MAVSTYALDPPSRWSLLNSQIGERAARERKEIAAVQSWLPKHHFLASASKKSARARALAELLRLIEAGERGFSCASGALPMGELAIPCHAIAGEYRRLKLTVLRCLRRSERPRGSRPLGFFQTGPMPDHRVLASESPEYLLDVCAYCHQRILGRLAELEHLPWLVRWNVRRFVDRLAQQSVPHGLPAGRS